ncbi:hypothetical protein I79_008347 [Cricetulus griseus]|uniref:Uncharacterized protein n=1 Tax=Cricetulus griseus TaxID=10029 RepID=G3HCX9_CRIGR|nr:hypothetical protein I79_008347 [Cricetulus griseus]
MTSPSFHHLSLAPVLLGKAQVLSADYSFLQEVALNLNIPLPASYLYPSPGPRRICQN